MAPRPPHASLSLQIWARWFDRLPAAFQGAVWMIIAAAAFAALILAVRVLSADFSPSGVLFWRSFFGLLMLTPSLVRSGPRRFKTVQLRLHVARTITMWLAMLLWYYAIANLVMADAVALQFTLPLFLVLLAGVFLDERTGLLRWMLMLIGFGGTLIILRPGFSVIGAPALAALSSALVYAVAHTMTKVMSRTEPGSIIAFYMNLFLLPLAAMAAVFDWTHPSWQHLPWLLALGVFGNLSQVMIARAFATAPASAVMPFDFLRLPFVAVFGFVLLDEVSDIWTWIGAGVIFGSAYAIARDEARMGGRRSSGS